MCLNIRSRGPHHELPAQLATAILRIFGSVDHRQHNIALHRSVGTWSPGARITDKGNA